jgi:hypothetical protein
MQLGLSSAAAPDAVLDDLLAACVRRGLAVLELRAGDSHGVAVAGPGSPIGDAVRRAAAAGVRITGLRIESLATGPEVAELAPAAGAARVPLLLAGGAGVGDRLERAAAVQALGASAVVVVSGDVPAAEVEAVLAAGFDVAWDAAASDLARAGSRVLGLAGERLRHIRLGGGGPETALQAGLGVGELMVTLALAGYAGSLILTPSSDRYRIAWRTWLGRRGGTGCGSKVSEPLPVRMPAPAAGGES